MEGQFWMAGSIQTIVRAEINDWSYDKIGFSYNRGDIEFKCRWFVITCNLG